MDLVINTDLFIVGTSITGVAVLGFLIFFNDKNSATSRAFLYLSIFTILYNGFNFLSYKFLNPSVVIWLLRITIFFAVWHSFYTFHLLYIFPEKEKKMPAFYKFGLLPFVAFTALLTLTPLVLKEVVDFSGGRVSSVTNGPGIVLFALVTVGLNLAGIAFFIKKTVKSSGEKRKQFLFVLFGFLLTILLLLIFNLVFPAFFNDSRFVTWGAAFSLPFLFFTYYAIIKHGLMNIKIISTELLVLGLSIAILFEVANSENLITVFYKSSLFLLVLSVGILLIKSVRNEVQAREKVVKLAASLEKANLRLQELDRQKTEFLSIASHQLRTPMSIIKGYIELIQDGAYGKITKETFKILADMDETNERLVKLIDEFLDVSRIEQGRTKFVFERKDMNELINSVTKELTQRAKDKKLGIEWKPGKSKEEIVMDEEKVRHVVFNFVDNAIKYSMEGTIKVLLEREKNGMTVRVKDNGIGFNKVDEANFFQKFYRGRNVKTANVGGTGLGIYVTKQFIEKHNGEVWAKSEGLGKGGEFGFWIPNNEQKLKEQEEDEKAAKAKQKADEEAKVAETAKQKILDKN